MAGLLDNKSRILDVIITQEGRRQLAQGGIQPKYYSFSDSGAQYKLDNTSGSVDITRNLYLESSLLPQDQIIFLSDDTGVLSSFDGAEIKLKNGQIMSSSQLIVSSTNINGVSQYSFGDGFFDNSTKLLNDSVNNFSKLRIIGTKDDLFEDELFSVGNKNLTFSINSNKPVEKDSYTQNIDNQDSIFNDPRFSVENFLFLPPIDKKTKKKIGNFAPINNVNSKIEYNSFLKELEQFESKTIRFDPTSKNNNLSIQMFEVDYSSLKKLDIIEFSQAKNGDGKLFLIGHIKIDNFGTHFFVHLFTLAF